MTYTRIVELADGRRAIPMSEVMQWHAELRKWIATTPHWQWDEVLQAYILQELRDGTDEKKSDSDKRSKNDRRRNQQGG